MAKRPTIVDLARVTGHSRSTISRAFNNRSDISAKTREFILRKAEKIGYTPHPGARTIKLGRTGRWGLLIPQLRNPWYGELTEAFDYEARQRNSMLVLGLSHYNAALERTFIRYWATGEVDGMIVTGTDIDENYSEYVKVKERGFPVVFLYGSPKDAFDSVRTDDFDNVMRILRHFYELGHRRIGYIGHRIPHARTIPTFRAYESLLAEKQIPLQESYLHFEINDYEAGEAAWRKWRTMPDRPTAVVCTGDVIACSLVGAVRKDNFQVPRDLSVVGQGDITEAARIGLTSIQVDRREFAATAFELLERPRAEDESQGLPDVRVVSTQLVWRDSIGAPAR